MKAKQIKQSIFAILMIAVLMVGTSAVSAGAATQKTYLDTMGYSEFYNPDSPENNFSPYGGEDRHGNKCTRAVKFYITGYCNDLSEEVINRGFTSYKVTYLLDGKFDLFMTELMANNNYEQQLNIGINFYGDGKLLYGTTVTENTIPLPLSVDVKNINMFTIELTSVIGYPGSNTQRGAVILNNAYFTSEGTTPEPTTTVEPTTKPEPTTTVEPTTKPEPATTVAPTTSKPVVIPTTAPASTATKATSSTEKATTKVKPTASTNATSKVSSPDTAGKTGTGLNDNVRNDNGTIKTGDVSIAVIVLLLISSLAAGGFAFYRRKIK